MHLRPFSAIVFVAFASVAQSDVLPAFPGAEGSGIHTPGGRGGEIFLVTTLDDSGPGSLRAGCEAVGPRIVIVNVSGTIELESPIAIRNPFITLAGQRAPGFGICLKNYGVRISADDVVVRYLRIRPGSGSGIVIEGGERVVIDHCSIGWTNDAGISIGSASRDVTVQWCIIAESLADGDNAKGVSIDTVDGSISLHHNVVAHHPRGFPFISGSGDEPGPLVDLRNNAFFDWVNAGSELGNGHLRVNALFNAYKIGPSVRRDVPVKAIRAHSTDNRFYIDDNELAGSEMASARNFFMIQMPDEFSTRHHGDMFKTDAPFETEAVTTLDTAAALSRVLDASGANRPRRDAVDERVIAQYRLGGGTIVSDPLQVGGWPEYENVDALPDSDSDGMPDAWETGIELDPSNASDAHADRDGDGYTNIEEYLNSTSVVRQ